MTGVFKANNPYNNFLLFVYGFLLKLPMFLQPNIPRAQHSDGFLYRSLLKLIAPVCEGRNIIYSIIAFILLYVQAITFNKLVNDQRLLPKSNSLAGMSYLLITSLFIEWHTLTSALVVNTFLIWILARLCNLYNVTNPKTALFDLGIITGVATFFYFPSILFAILIIAGMAITRPFKLTEWIVAFIGILIPYYFLGAWIFLTDGWKRYHFPWMAISIPAFHDASWAYVSIILILSAVVIGGIFNQNNMLRLLVQSRKNWHLIYLYLGIAVLVPFFNATKSFSYFILAAVPMSALAAAAFLFPERKWFAIVVHWSFVALTVVVGYFIK
ncbi:MAG: DUF6427 family protein [Ferruginibacter sp.]